MGDELTRIINVVAVIQGVFLGLLLFFRKKNTASNRIFALLIFIVSVSMATNSFRTTSWTDTYYYMFLLNMSCYPIYGPLIYLYTLSMTGSLQKVWSRYLIHFVPFIFFALYLILRHPINDWTGHEELFSYLSSKSLFHYRYVIILFLSIILVYIFSSLLQIRRYKKKLKEYFSDAHKLNMLWLSVMYAVTSAFVIILILSLIFHRDSSSSDYEYEPTLQVLIFGTFFILIYITAYFTVRHPNLFNTVDTDEKAPKYEKLRIDEKTRRSYIARLLEFMDSEKPYLNDSLTLRDLAEKIDIPHYYLSLILNTEIKQNFYTFINTYRVNEAKQCLLDPLYKDTNILTVAYNSGFNSKTTFNTIFRQIAGMTPSEFRKRQGSVQ